MGRERLRAASRLGETSLCVRLAIVVMAVSVKPGPFGPRVLVPLESDLALTVFFSIFLDVSDGMNMIGMVHGSFGRGFPRRSYPVMTHTVVYLFVFIIWSRV